MGGRANNRDEGKGCEDAQAAGVGLGWGGAKWGREIALSLHGFQGTNSACFCLRTDTLERRCEATMVISQSAQVENGRGEAMSVPFWLLPLTF